MDKYYPQIDTVKSLAIISVIILHTVSSALLTKSYAIFYVWQAVPVFLVVIGVNLSVSYSKYNLTSLKQYYSRNFLHRCKRVLLVFFITLLVAWILCLIKGDYNIGWRSWLGVFPMGAPGNYFLTIILELLFVAPLLVYFYRKNTVGTLVACILFNLAFELVSPYIPIDTYIYHSAFLRVLTFIALGLYLGKELVNDRLSGVFRNRFIQAGILISVVYLAICTFCNWSFPLFPEFEGTQNLLSAFYPFLIVLLILNVNLDRFKNGVIFNFVTLIGKASYHIFLFQLLYFGLRFGSYGAGSLLIIKSILVNLAVTVSFGIAFYYAENYFWKLVKRIYANTRSLRTRLA
jgi:peptidoglycan/LPS O-acetylase OafA/YrhL